MKDKEKIEIYESVLKDVFNVNIKHFKEIKKELKKDYIIAKIKAYEVNLLSRYIK